MFESKAKINMWVECGDEYYYGENGEIVDYEMAVIFYERAAKKKHPHATYMLGLCYELGRGVAKNDAYANELYKKAAEYGDRDAIKRLSGDMPDNKDAPQSAKAALQEAQKQYHEGAFDKALRLLETQASELPYAQYMLGVMCKNGEGVPADARAAAHWYEKAAAQGLADAQYNLGILHYTGDGVKQDYKKTLYWYEQAAESGDSLAQHDTANMYYNGIGTAVDLEKAAAWYEKSATQGDSEAQFSLAKLYENGEGVDRNNAEATLWMTRAAEQGHLSAQLTMAQYYDIAGVAGQDDDRRLFWYGKAAEQGDITAAWKVKNVFPVNTLRSLSDEKKIAPDILKDKIKSLAHAERPGFDPLALTFLLIKTVRGMEALFDEDVVRAYTADLLPSLPELRALSAALYSSDAIDLLMNGKRDIAGAARRLTDAGVGLYEAETVVRCLIDVLDYPNNRPAR